jgi:nucleotide-binding universal stress UspA family protein
LRIPTTSPVVVGVNGTAASLAAVRLGAREAVSRGRLLRIVHAYTWAGEIQGPETQGRETQGRESQGRESRGRHAAEQLLAEAAATAQRSTPGVRVDPQLVDGPADRVLIQLSRTAELLVMGNAPPVSSVLVQTAALAFCPVVVARGPRPPAGPVLAAVDGSPWSVQALRHAAFEARRRGVSVEAVHVVSRAGYRAEDEGRAILAAAVAEVPELRRARSRLLTGAPGPALARASARARMVVLGPRGTGRAALLGSVARHLLHQGASPTVFVHGPALPAPRVPDRSGRSSTALAG